MTSCESTRAPIARDRRVSFGEVGNRDADDEPQLASEGDIRFRPYGAPYGGMKAALRSYLVALEATRSASIAGTSTGRGRTPSILAPAAMSFRMTGKRSTCLLTLRAPQTVPSRTVPP